MAEETPLPFDSFAFTLVEDRKPRLALRLKAADEGLFELHVEKGSAANPSMQFTRVVPVDAACRLRDSLQSAGVFGWEETYGDTTAPGSRRWSVTTVFKEGVFSVASRGGSDAPKGFDEMLEALYRLDFPRSSQPKAQQSSGGAFDGFADGFDLSRLSSMMGEGELENLGSKEMLDLMMQARSNPQALQERMREEFRHMPPDEQERLLDMLASAGMASRAWWERYLRGY